ncbi:MAG: hypothetical protein H6715_02625 [Myxococcales bacterium]|nr:hypothetical protein [Myxococcales bacterium]MCB9708700.1 hypothetical protein [Myxococcales bacterium]
MKLAKTPLFESQRRQFSLRFTCEECTLFDAVNERCAHGYPVHEHRDAYYAHPEGLIVFCKDFDLV